MKDTPNPNGPAIGASGRRTFSKEFKRRAVMQSLVPGVSVSRIARVHDINANQLFKWRREHTVEIGQANTSTIKLLPVTVSGSETSPACQTGPTETRRHGTIEVDFNAARMVMHGNVDLEAVRIVMQCLRR